MSSVTVSPRTNRIISRTRLYLRILSFLLSASMVAVLGHTVGTYLDTKDGVVVDDRTGVILRVWLRNMKARPTYVLLIVSSVATLLSIGLIISNFWKTMRQITNISNLATALVCMIGVALWLGVGAYYKSDDILVSYTCGLSNATKVSKTVNMRALCIEMRYAWWIILVLGTLELASAGTVSWAMWAAKRKGTYSRI
ncbi:hypothetical protein K505DRAFT_257088 [Melanomma pulvis-pyrius CBS 109.77]|uniref:MARVEL domain-containing protein n=1 Tax=Melanomma pulvis-pyrius CBS 109.77 TaxID=1314802 RepID=A0A6A6WVF4_9PLEO|nr:hypothetical protein K505DRAFT_257088 [Melanomma pulvis-pyrius CBS 109.77]